MVKYPHVKVQLTGEDGNAFMIIGRVAEAIHGQVGPDETRDFCERAMSTGSYEELLTLVQETVYVL